MPRLDEFPGETMNPRMEFAREQNPEIVDPPAATADRDNRQITYSYDSGGYMSGETRRDSSGTITDSYDSADRQTGETRFDSSGHVKDVLAYA